MMLVTFGRPMPFQMCEANAHLIAAAPDMYEALKVTLKNLGDGYANENLSIKTMIKQVLAKAEE